VTKSDKPQYEQRNHTTTTKGHGSLLIARTISSTAMINSLFGSLSRSKEYETSKKRVSNGEFFSDST